MDQIYFQHFLKGSDYIWKRHCERNFKVCNPNEGENWRDLYKVSIFCKDII